MGNGLNKELSCADDKGSKDFSLVSPGAGRDLQRDRHHHLLPSTRVMVPRKVRRQMQDNSSRPVSPPETGLSL